MLGGNETTKNWVAITLQNTNVDFPTTVKLFDAALDYSGTTQYLATPVTFNFSTTASWTVTTSTGATVFSGDFANMAAVIDAFNEVFIEAGQGVFSFEEITSTTFSVFAYSDEFTFVSITPHLEVLQAFVATASLVTPTTSAIVTSESEVTMNEITQEFVYSPYLLFAFNTYANTLAQSNNTINVASRFQSGRKRTDLKFPAINPMQQQFALEDVEINFLPSSLNEFNYTINAGQSVRLIFKYIGGNISEIMEIHKNYDAHIKQLKSLKTGAIYRDPKYLEYNLNEETMKKKRMIMNPMLALVNGEPERPLAGIIEDYQEDRTPATDDEIMNAFSGSDFREIED